MFSLRALELIFAFIAASTLAQDDRSTDPNISCQPYSYPPLDAYVNELPTAWEPAKILPNDAEAWAMWYQISPSILNIPPKLTSIGTCPPDYDFVNDPDCYWTCTQCTHPKLQGLPPDVSSVPEPKTVGYGFDDGPNCSHNVFYDYLASQNQKATMFYIGSNVRNWPKHGLRGFQDGHEMCVHTWSHNYMTSFSSEDAFAELWYTMKIIRIVTGVTPTCWRPAFGDIDDRIRSITHALGLRTILWGFDAFDWKIDEGNWHSADTDGEMWLFINNLTAGNFDTEGGIILTHELNNNTMTAAIKWLPTLKSYFSHIVPVASALNKTHPYRDSDYSYPTFEQYNNGDRPT